MSPSCLKPTKPGGEATLIVCCTVVLPAGSAVAALWAALVGLNVTWLFGFYSFLLGACLFPITLGVWWGGRDRLGRGRVAMENGISGDARMVLEGEVEPLLRIATGSVLSELGNIRIRPH